jgi:hypothetical protein
MIEFRRPIDPTTVQVQDFLINGQSPVDARTFRDEGARIYLSLPFKLEPGASAKIEIVGSTTDIAGRALGGVSGEAEPGF